MGNKRRKPVPLAPPPTMRSRKRARVVTTLFHKYTRDRDAASRNNDLDLVRECDEKIAAMGGREEYQRASVCSTKHHSTSRRWVLSVLGKRGWLEGIVVDDDDDEVETAPRRRRARTRRRRNVRLLEVGAINTDLVDAAKRTRTVRRKIERDDDEHDDERARSATAEAAEETTKRRERVYRLDVRAIDLQSVRPDVIEEADFLTLPLSHPTDVRLRYDVIVCSMVINCVPAPEDRGRMLWALYRHLRPGGLCFLTLPRLCLRQSRFLTEPIFREMLTDCVGFRVEDSKESPKVAFYVLRRPDAPTRTSSLSSMSPRRRDAENDDDGDDKKQLANVRKWTKVKVVNKPKKYRNTFSVVFCEEDVERSHK